MKIKNILPLVIGLIAEAMVIIYLVFNLNQLTIIEFMLLTVVLPLVIVGIATLLNSYLSKNSRKELYLIDLIYGLFSAAFLIVFCLLFVDQPLIEALIANTNTSENVQVSVKAATAGDNIQSILLFIAASGIGTMIGLKLRKKGSHKNSRIVDLYD